MFRDEDYLSASDEPYLSVEADSDDSIWAGSLYERTSGGFDLFYFHENSEFPKLDLASITKLRHLCEPDGGLFFIEHIPAQKSENALLNLAKQGLLTWIAATIP